jgi:predicted nucleic acid-binding protein
VARIYVETTIASYLTAKPSRDVIQSAKQLVTQRWWEAGRHRHELFISELVLEESAQGDPDAAGRRMNAIQAIPRLAVSDAAALLAKRLVRGGGLPEKALMDALHVATATTHGMEILLTWNCKHIANPVTYPLLEAICAGAGFRAPILCTPFELEEGEDNED